jgi:hypothetical protein
MQRLEMKANVCRLAYHIRWTHCIQERRETNNTDTDVNVRNRLTYPKSEFISYPKTNPALEHKLKIVQNEINRLIDNIPNRKFGTNLTEYELNELKVLKSKDMTYLPSDKGGEFCVVNKSTYISLGQDHLNNTNTYEQLPSLTPKTIEKRINHLWKSICKRRSISYSSRRSFITNNSRIPSFYHLVKTHKTGPTLKIRPIVSAINSPHSKIMWLLTKLITPLLKFVNAHLFSSGGLIRKPKNLSLSMTNKFSYPFSLDVEALYTSIPANEAVRCVVQLINDHHIPTYGLHTEDISDLLQNVINNFYFEYESVMYKQKEGLPMGTSISGPLAIIYMNDLENKFLTTNPNLGLYARYVDDIFILTTSRNEAENIFQALNNIDSHINFTIEYPVDSKQLSLLDFTVTMHTDQSPTFEFFRKSARKPVFIHCKSSLPTQQKRNIIHNELTRISERCSDKTSRHKNVSDFRQILNKHGYGSHKYTCIPTNRRRSKHRDDQTIHYLQIPFISDGFDNKINGIFKKHKFNVRIAHQSYTLRNYLKSSRPIQICKLNNCPINDSNICFRQHVIYEVKCNKCLKFYIGSTIRPLHIRVREHTTQDTSSVFKHLKICQHTYTKWDIETKVIGKHKEAINLRFMEAIMIKEKSPALNSQIDFHVLDHLLY